jgi:cytidylate kinase
MSVITISMKVGSEGSHIAEKVAQTLGYHFADKRTIGKVLSQYGLVEFDEEYDSAPGFWARFNAQREERRKLMVDMLNRVILALAHHGDMVILGRGGFAVLGGFADVLKVRIQAPLPIRIKRVMEQQNITEPERAEAFVTENDRVRIAFVESWYGVRWDTASPFDLVIDTGKVPPELATTWLVEANRVAKERKGGDERTTGTIQVDPILASAVSDEFKCHVAHG